MNDNNQWMAPPPQTRATEHISHHIGPQSQALEHIGHQRSKIDPIRSEIDLPCLDLLPDDVAPQPQASLLPQP